MLLPAFVLGARRQVVSRQVSLNCFPNSRNWVVPTPLFGGDQSMATTDWTQLFIANDEALHCGLRAAE